MTLSLFEQLEQNSPQQDRLCEGATLLRRFAFKDAPIILEAINTIITQAPLRQMLTPGGRLIAVAMSNCGDYGWISDRQGYRYCAVNPQTHEPWPKMPTLFRSLAQQAAAQVGFTNFSPDACLINRYVLGTGMSLHQDKDERDFNQPIVSVSLGMAAVFLLGGQRRQDKTQRIALWQGDVLVMGGAGRMRYHGVQPLKHQPQQENPHPLIDSARINLTFRQAM